MSLALVFLVYGEIMSFKCKENQVRPGVVFVVVDVSDGDFGFFFVVFHFLILVQGFSIKVLMQKYCLHDDSCSRTMILTRSGNSENIVCLRCALSYQDSL